MTSIFPSGLFPRSEAWAIRSFSRSMGSSLSAVEQVIASPYSLWTARLSFDLSTDEEVRKFRAFVAAVRGRSEPILVGPNELRRAPWPVDSYGRKVVPSLNRRPLMDGTSFADTTSHIHLIIDAAVSGAYLKGNSVILIQMNNGSAILEGMEFTISDRLYMVTKVNSVISGNIYSLNIQPALRSDITGTAKVSFTDLKTKMRLVEDSSGAMEIEYARYAQPTLDMIEVL